MRAKKENKIYTINTEQEAARYLDDGYDIYNDEGEVLDYSPKKKIAFSEYMKLKKENEELAARLAEVVQEAGDTEAENNDTDKSLRGKNKKVGA